MIVPLNHRKGWVVVPKNIGKIQKTIQWSSGGHHFLQSTCHRSGIVMDWWWSMHNFWAKYATKNIGHAPCRIHCDGLFGALQFICWCCINPRWNTPKKNKLSSGTKTYCTIFYTDWLMMIDDEDQTMIIAKQFKGSVIPTIMTNHHFSTTSPYFFVGQNQFFRECFQKTKLW